MLELLLGQIFEAIYFALFMIFAKRIKEKKIIIYSTNDFRIFVMDLHF